MQVRRIKALMLLLAVVIFLSVSSKAYAWVNLYQYSAFEYTFVKKGKIHTVSAWNTGETHQNFMNVLFIINEVRIGQELYVWDGDRFVIGRNKLFISGYDGVFNNSQGVVSGVNIGIWPYYSLGNLYFSSNQSEIFFYVNGKYDQLEGDFAADYVYSVAPEPQSLLLLIIGLAGLIFRNVKKR